MAVITKNGHVNRAVAFINMPSMYFSVGKQTAWADEEHPPLPDANASDITNILGYKEVATKHMVVPDAENGTLDYGGMKWRIVVPGQVFNVGAMWVYLDTYLEYDEIPLGEYRQIGVYSGLEKNTGVLEGKRALIPTDVKKSGNLEIIENRKVTKREANQKELLSFLIQF